MGAMHGWYDIDKSNINLMQFTGLNDSNGKEIYEGDVLKVWNPVESKPSLLVVAYRAPSFCVYFAGDERKYLMDFARLRGSLDNEIVGNIYANPELMEV